MNYICVCFYTYDFSFFVFFFFFSSRRRHTRFDCDWSSDVCSSDLHRESLSPRIKSLNYLSHILAKVEGIAAGVDEVIMLDSSGYVAEASGMNLGMVKRGVVRTPPPYAGILRGVTRDAVLELAREAGHAVAHRR